MLNDDLQDSYDGAPFQKKSKLNIFLLRILIMCYHEKHFNIMKNKNNLCRLPEAFYSEERFDTDIFREIFDQSLHASAFLKKLVKLTQHDIPKNTDDRLALVCKYLPEPKFRDKWYDLIENKKSKKMRWDYFYQLTNCWVLNAAPDQAFPNIKGIDQERKRLLFDESPNGAWYIRPSSIPMIIEDSYNCDVEPRIVALYLWTFSEAAIWRDYKPAQFNYESSFFTSKVQVVTKEYVSEIKRLLKPNLLVEEKNKVKNSPLVRAAVVNQEIKGKINKVESDVLVSKTSKSIFDFDSQLNRMLAAIEKDWAEHKLKVDGLSCESNDLKYMPSSKDKISCLKEAVLHVENKLTEIHDSMNMFCIFYRDSLKSIGESIIGRMDLVESTLLSDVDDIDIWIEQHAINLREINECEGELLTYREFSKKLNTYDAVEKWEGPFEDCATLISWVKSRNTKMENMIFEFDSIQKFKDRCAVASLDLKWNPLDDKELDIFVWKTLCSSLQKDAINPYLMGLVLRLLIEDGGAEIDSMLKITFGDWGKNIGRTCKILSILSNEQIDQLWIDSSFLRPILSVCSLNSWFIASKNNDATAIDYWYQAPLKDVSLPYDNLHVHMDKSVNIFLCNLKSFVTKVTNFSGGSLQQIISSLGEKEVVTRSRVNELYAHVEQHILKEPNYSGNYGRLADLAYKELLNPFHDAIKVRDPELIRVEYGEFRKDFDFSEWYIRKTSGFEKRFISSQHKKRTQQYVEERFECLERWINAELSSSNSLSKDLLRMKDSVEKVIEQYRKKSHDDNVDYLNVIGWWLSKLEKNIIPPSISATNPVELLENSFISPKLIDECVFPWRCIEEMSKGTMPVFGVYFADVLSNWANSNCESMVIKKWQEDDRVECLKLYMVHNESMKEGDDYDIEDIKGINSKLDAFQSDLKVLFQEELKEIKDSFGDSDWNALKGRIVDLKIEVETALRNYGNNKKRQKLSNDIQYLGGETSSESTLANLEKQLNELLQKATDRMAHIKAIQQLMQLPELPDEIFEDIKNVTNIINQPLNLPDEDRAEWLKCLFEEIFNPLSNLLNKPNRLLPEYRELLLSLLSGIIQILFNTEWIESSESETEKLLVQISSTLNEEDCIDDVHSTKQFLEWFLSKSNGLSLHNINIDLGSDRDNVNNGPKQRNVTPLGSLDEMSDISKARKIIVDELNRYSNNLSGKILVSKFESKKLDAALNRQNWDEVAMICVANLRENNDDILSDDFLLIVGLSLGYALGSKNNSDIVEGVLLLIERIGIDRAPKIFSRKSQKTEKNILGCLTSSWLFDSDINDINSFKIDEENSSISAVHLSRVIGDKHIETLDGFSSPVLNSLWEFASGESSWGAKFRASLLSMCVKSGMSNSLIYLLKKDPIKMHELRANLFFGLIERANDAPGWERLSGFLESERNKLRSKPFLLFSESLLNLRKPRDDKPAEINVSGPVVKSKGKNLWTAVINVVPSVLDPPHDIVLLLPNDSPILFGSDKVTTQRLSGPFLDRMQIRVELNIKESYKGKFSIEVQCRVKTLQDVQIEYMQSWLIDTGDADDSFISPTPEFVTQCFGGFPHRPMRGKDFVPRDMDEKTIEDVLFNSQDAGSLWITSPRRSGKTSMLFRILDSFSYKEGRDDIVLYFTMSSQFDSEKSFNSWIWRRILKGPENKELKEHIKNLDLIGANLDMDVDVDIFISELANKLLIQLPAGARVYFVIDEVDRFAEMYLEGGAKRGKSMQIMWQLRNLISSETNVGIVFAGSHAARRFFIADSQAPFYNSILEIKLSPFNVETPQSETRTRDIVQPKNLVNILTVPKDTVRHILRITAGIPYYMKLLSGSTYAFAKHAQILPADVNEGVSRMLEKNTGIKTIDMLENPGEDELRTLYAESINEKALIKGVLLAVANIRSPISGIPVKVGEIWSERSPLVVRAGLNRELIEPALTHARNLGFLKTSSTSEYQVEFSIPLLGESMRRRFHTLWADIEKHLENIGHE